jgi:hypothetical protein
MRRIYLFVGMCLMATIGLSAQSITGKQVTKVLTSDNFEGKTPWQNFDTQGIVTTLNNELGGDMDCYWGTSLAWGGACYNSDYSARNDSTCVQLHWGGTVALQGFTIDQAKTYQLEVDVHAGPSVAGGWNDWAGIHLYVLDDSQIWQTQGMRIRITNGNATGGNPNSVAYDVWEGQDGANRAGTAYSFNDKLAQVGLDDAKDASRVDYWIPVKIIFQGAATKESPMIADVYLNNEYAVTISTDSMVWFGDQMIGLQNSNTDGSDQTKFDNFKLSEMGVAGGEGKIGRAHV